MGCIITSQRQRKTGLVDFPHAGRAELIVYY